MDRRIVDRGTLCLGGMVSIVARVVRAADAATAPDASGSLWNMGGVEVLAAGFAVVVLLLAIWFARAFTQPLQAGTAASEAELKPMVCFCYAFTVFCLLVSAAPPLLLITAPQRLYYRMLRTPLALVKGCVHAKEQGSDWELACNPNDPFKMEWFVNIGGAARLSHGLPGVPDAIAPQTANANARDGSLWTIAADGPAARSHGELQAIDRWIDSQRYAPAIVHGGVAVPWYLITLAVMGATVSLARKVPEYQRRAVDTGDESMSGPRMREALEFEVLQVLSAPLIAITAYNVLLPADVRASVALGFTSGFASSPILMAIRAFADRIIGRDAPTPAPGGGDATGDNGATKQVTDGTRKRNGGTQTDATGAVAAEPNG